MIGGEIADGGGGITSPVAQEEEDVDARLDWAGCGGLRTEVGDGLIVYGIIIIVKGDERFCGLADMLGGDVPRYEKVPDEEHEVHEGPKLDRP